MRLLAFDPGASTGWALTAVYLNPTRNIITLDAGRITFKPPRKTKSHPTPIMRYYNEALSLIEQHNPQVVIIEGMFIKKIHASLKTISGMYRPRLLIELAANSLSLPTREIAPSSWRSKVGGLPRKADKDLSILRARQLAPDIHFPDNQDDIAEAILIGHAAAEILFPAGAKQLSFV